LEGNIKCVANYKTLAVVPSVGWDFLFDKHINLPNLLNLSHSLFLSLKVSLTFDLKKLFTKFLRLLRLLVLFYIGRLAIVPDIDRDF
jgi:hypothetical protein